LDLAARNRAAFSRRIFSEPIPRRGSGISYTAPAYRERRAAVGSCEDLRNDRMRTDLLLTKIGAEVRADAAASATANRRTSYGDNHMIAESFVVSEFRCVCGAQIEAQCELVTSCSGYTSQHFLVVCPKCGVRNETPTRPLRLIYEDADHWSTMVLESGEEEWPKTMHGKVFTYRSEPRESGGYWYTCSHSGASVSGDSSIHRKREDIENLPQFREFVALYEPRG
jgi:hypothetical protein